MSHSAPPPSPPPTDAPGCARCGGNKVAVHEAQQEIRGLARSIEQGAHTLRARTALRQLPAAKERLREARRRAAEHTEAHELGEVS